MPMIRKRTPGRKTSGITQDQFDYLVAGVCLDEGQFPFADETQCREMWEQYRHRIMGMMGKPEGFSPGRRPEGWWMFDWDKDKHGLREQTGRFHIHPVEPLTEYHRGTYCHWSGYIDDELDFESQYDFLERNGLLLPGEEAVYEKIHQEKTGVAG